MSISSAGIEDIQWWINNVATSYKNIVLPKIKATMYTDASGSIGWGAVCNPLSTGGLWLDSELVLHINVKELVAIYFGLLSIIKVKNSHVKVFTDNTTAVCAVNKLGTCRSINCHKVAQLIWEWARKTNNFVTAAHIPGIQNIHADKESRSKHHEDMEWMLDRTLKK